MDHRTIFWFSNIHFLSFSFPLFSFFFFVRIDAIIGTAMIANKNNKKDQFFDVDIYHRYPHLLQDIA